MGKGPGKWQRLILDNLEQRDFVVVCDLLQDTAKRAEQSALNRAAHKLADAGKVDLTWRSREASTSHPNSGRGKCSPTVVVVTSPGVSAPVQYRGEWMPREQMLAIHYRIG